jgi:hypothetical protein
MKTLYGCIMALTLLGILDYKDSLDIREKRSALVADMGVPADSLKNLQYKNSFIPLWHFKGNNDTSQALSRAVDSVKIAKSHPTWDAKRVSHEVRTLWR